MDDNKYNKRNASSKNAYHNAARSWKFAIGLIAFIVLWFRLFPLSSSSSQSVRPLSTKNMKILYCMTTLSEYDNGKRATTKGYDRLQETAIPILKESVESMILHGYQVDVVLICGYEMTREYLIRQALPDSAGLQIWSSATPRGYKLEDKNSNITTEITRGLARQHRFIIKDKLPYYDFFVNFEDDMLVKGTTITNYIEITNELYRLRASAPEHSVLRQEFYGPLSKQQLQRMIPGLIRVEVLLDEKKYGAQDEIEGVPVTDRPELDPTSCCYLKTSISDHRPASPASDKLFSWETSIKALGIRKMPVQAKTMDWVLMQRGPRMNKDPLSNIADYWSGTDKQYFGDERRPDTKAFKYINNQGGWMATRSQIWEWHTQICPGGFLPPYDFGEYNYDGLDMRNVEYWSGGMHLVTKEHGCNLQRIIPLNETQFARSLLYHTANNKQRQLHGRRAMFVKINDLYGQLNTVIQNAQNEMNRRVMAMNDALHHT